MNPQRPTVVEIQAPLGGLAEDVATSKQTPGTARIFRNVVPVDPRTGKTRLSSRAGFSKLTSRALCGDGNPVQAVAPFNFPVARRRRVVLTDTAQATVDPQAVEAEWSKVEQGAVVAVDTLPLNDVATLLSSGQVVIRNPQGKLVGAVRSPIPVGFTAVPHLVVDEFGGIVIGCAVDAEVEGGAGRLFRFMRDENDVWTMEWELAFTGKVVHFDARLGELVVIERPTSGENIGRDQLVRVAGMLGEPSIEDRRDVAWPAYTVTLDRFGAAFVSSPPNALRGDPSNAFTERNESWTPREIVGWKTRLHAWIDGLRPTSSGEALVAGDVIPRLEDARHYPSGFGVVDDPTIRDLYKDPSGDWDAPTWDGDAFGGLGAVRFDAQTVVMSDPNRDETDRSLQGAIVPGIAEAFALFMVVQVDTAALAASTDYRILSHAGDEAQMALKLLATAISGGFEVDVQDETGSLDTASTTAAATTALLTIYHDGAASTTSRVRLNGTHIGDVTVTNIETGGAFEIGAGVDSIGPRTIIGRHRSTVDGNLLVGAASLQRWDVFNTTGEACEQIRNGVTAESSSVEITAGAFGFTIRASFGGNDVAADGIELWCYGSSGARALSVEVGTAAFGTPAKTYTFDITLSGGNIAIQRFWLDFGEVANYEFFEFILDSGNPIRITEMRLCSRSEQGAVLLAAAAGRTALANGAPMALGEILVLMSPTEPGAANTSGGTDVASSTEVENVEGYLAHRFGISHLLAADHVYFDAGNYPVGIGDVTASATDRGANNAPGGILAKYAPNGALIAAKTGPGYGYGCAVDDDGFVWSIGPRQESGTAAWLNRLRDEGQRLEESGDGVLVKAGDEEAEPANQPIVPRVDGAGVLHIPLLRASGESRYLRVQPDGDTISVWGSTSGVTPTGVALGPDVLDAFISATPGAEYAYLGEIGGQATVSKLTLIGSEETGETRTRRVGLATVSCGDVFVHDAETGEQLAIGATEVFDDRARIARTSAFGRLFLSDGRRAMVYDPLAGTLARMEAAGYGSAPSGFGLVELWQGRLVMARLEDDPAAVLATGRGRTDDYDLFPPVPLQGQAFVLAGLDRIGRLPEPVTALAAVDDDVLVIATTTSLFALSGDPTQGAGLDTISTEVGMPLGQAWARDPFGRLHFLDDAGRVWRWSRGQGLEELTSNTIRERLRRIDWTIYAPEMCWAHYADGFFLYVVPRNLVAESIPHLYWSAKTGAWSEVTFDDLTIQPMSASQIDGDSEATRLHIIGCADGHVRYWDRTSSTDDGFRIDSDVLIGPMGIGSGSGMLRFTGLEVDLAQEHGGALAEFHVGDTAEQPGRAAFSWPLSAGPNGPKSARSKGRWGWLRLRGRQTGEPWAFERGSVQAYGAGRRRIRNG